jgi:glycosyltransferase involved in cell wall biosynthesis
VRIVHVVNLVDSVGSYGGPLRVALNQVEALGQLGHEAVLLAGASAEARDEPANAVGAVPARLRRSWNIGGTAGFTTRWAPGVHWWLLRHARSQDVVQVHLSRDLTTAPAAALLRLLRVPYVVQTHGMIDPSGRKLAAVLDALLVRPVLAGAAKVLVLTDKERDDVAAVARGRDLPFEVVPNGVRSREGEQRTVAAGELPEVLFLSRLQERKRPVNFVRAALALRRRGVRARFTLVGPDEGELGSVQAALAAEPDSEGLVSYAGVAPMSGSVDRIARASVFVLPSVQEPFPMAVVEAMSAGVPVICSESCGLAPLVAAANAGVVVPDDDLQALEGAIAGYLDDLPSARTAGRNGLALVERELSIDAVARTLVAAYSSAVAPKGGPDRIRNTQGVS